MLTADNEISHGTISSTMMSPKDILKRAIINNAYGIILAHNHSSGDSNSSFENITVTNRIKEAAELLEIRLINYLIIGDDSYVSMHEYIEKGD